MEVRNYDRNGKIAQQTIYKDYFHPIDSVKAILYERVVSETHGPSKFLGYWTPYTIRRTFNTPYQIETTTASTPSGIVENTNGDIITWGSSVRTRKDLAYDSSFLLKTEVVIDSKGDTIKTEYKRAIDYANPSPTLAHMLDTAVNIVQPVIEQIVSNNDSVISATGNRYEVQNGMVNLTATYNYNRDVGNFTPSADGYSFPSPYELQTEYSLYDSQNGKLLEYKARDGVTNSFVWGYNRTLPVIHGEGVTYNDLYQAHLDATATPVPDYETAIRNHANTAGKRVTTYAHNPQVGISRLTDPAGLKKTFEYDSYGRLKKVVDNDGKTLEQYAYHFREPPPTRILSVSGDIDFGILTPDFFETPFFEHYKKCSDGRTSRILTLSNTGESDLTVNSISLPSNFTSSWAGGVISPGTSVDVIISFDNNDGNIGTGSYGGTLSMSTNKTAGDSLASVTATYAARVCDISLSTSVFNFGRTTGNILNQPLILTNNGNAPIRIIGLPLDWDGATAEDYSTYTHPDFSVGTTIPPTLTTDPLCIDPGGSLSIPLNYRPTSTSATQTKLSVITEECPALVDVVTIKGEKVPLGTPFLDTEPSPIEMPEFTSASTSRTITVSNLSMFPATVESISSDNPNFTISPFSGFVLDGFGEKTFTLAFAPDLDDFSEQSSIIHFQGNVPEATFSRTVTGHRTEVRTVSLSTTQITIDGHGSGTLTVTNNGNSNVTLTGVMYETPGGAYTSTSSWWSAGFTPVATPTLTPGQSTTMSIQSISSASESQNIQVQYSKTGVLDANDVVLASALNRNINVSAISFPSFTDPSVTTSFQISNPDGNATLTVQNITSSNSRFTLSGSPALTFPFYLDPGQSRSVSVTYTPTDFSLQTSNIVITSNATNATGPFTAVASAQRTEVRTVSLSASQVTIDGHGSGTLTVTNNGNTSLTLTGVKYAAPGLPYGSTSTSWSAGFTPVTTPTLAPGQSTTLSIQSISSDSQTENIQVQYNKTGAYNANDEVQVTALNRNIAVSAITFPSFTAASVSTNFTVSNPNGNASLTISNITSSNSRFTLSPLTFPLTVDRGASITLTITYTPTDFGVQTSNIVFTSNATNTTGPVTVGTSAQRTEVRTVSLSTNQVTVAGHGSGTLSVTNDGNSSLTLTGVNYAAPGLPYGSTSTSWSAGFTPVATPTLAPGQSTTLNIQSISSDSQTENIQVQYNKTGAYNANDEVQATALNRNIGVSVITFPSFTAASVSTNSTVSNPNGNASLTISNITSSNSRFTLSPLTFPLTVDPGASITLTVTYTPTDFSVQTSNIVFTSNATNITTGPLQVSTSAQRTAIRTIALSPGTVTANGYQWQSVSMNNTGNDNVTISGVSYAFLNTSTYTSSSTSWTTSFSSGLPLTLAPGQSSSFSVMPTGSNPDDQKIRVEYNKTSGYTSSDEVQAFAEITRELNGVPTSYAFPSFTGASSSHAITVSNGGNSTLTISSISSTNSRFTASPSSLTLGPGGSQTVTVTYNPSDFSLQSGTITFNSDRTGGNSAMSVSGQRTQYYHISVSSYSLVVKPSFPTVSSYVTNTGNINATINSVGNSNPSKFRVTVYRYSGGSRITASFPAALSPGQQLEIEVKSADGSFTSATGYAQVTPNQGSAFNINLSRSPTP